MILQLIKIDALRILDVAGKAEAERIQDRFFGAERIQRGKRHGKEFRRGDIRGSIAEVAARQFALLGEQRKQLAERIVFAVGFSQQRADVEALAEFLLQQKRPRR